MGGSNGRTEGRTASDVGKGTGAHLRLLPDAAKARSRQPRLKLQERFRRLRGRSNRGERQRFVAGMTDHHQRQQQP